MDRAIRVIQFGLGAIGQAAARLVLERENLQLVGAVDADPKFAGQDLGRVLGVGRDLGMPVTESIDGTLKLTDADAVIHCTGSSFAAVFPQLEEIVGNNLHCVTSCEEALVPAYRNPDLANELQTQCVSHSVSVLGTGVNPGFVMDTLAVVSTAVCQRVDAVRIRRVVDAGTRREALQRKVGAGMEKAEFEALVAEGRMGHVGLLESLVFVGQALGWSLVNISETVAPMIASGSIKTQYLSVLRGQVTGVQQVARAERAEQPGVEALRLELQMYVGAAEPRDEIEIAGKPTLRVTVPGGTPGDIATPAILVNLLPLVVAAVPGLQTMATLPLPRLSRGACPAWVNSDE